MSEATHERAAALLAGARLARTRLDGLPPECRPHDQADAYAVQARLHAALTARGWGGIAGHKMKSARVTGTFENLSCSQH